MFLHRTSLRAFTLADVLIAVTLTSFLVIIVMGFVQQVLQYSTFVARHQQIRMETFALLNNALSSVIREAVAIDYENTDEHRLSLFMDKLETQRIVFRLEPPEYRASEDRSQLVLEKGDTILYLNSPRTVMDLFQVDVPQKPSTSSKLQEARALQPLVQITLAAHHQLPPGTSDRSLLTFLQDPRISYQGTYVLRNYSFSSLRHSP